MVNIKVSNNKKAQSNVSGIIHDEGRRGNEPRCKTGGAQLQARPSRVALRLGALRFYVRHKPFSGGSIGVGKRGRALVLIATVSFLWSAADCYGRPINTDQPKDSKIEGPAQPASKAADKPDNGAAPKSQPETPKAAGSSDSSGLTERERALLDRIDRLERRVAELESHPTNNTAINAAATTPAMSAGASQPPAGGASTLGNLPASGAPVAASTKPDAAGAPVAPVTSVAAGAAQAQKPAKPEPFAFGDFTWLTGNSRQKDFPLDTKVFTGELRVDVDFVHDFNHPKDDTIGGSSEIFRANEFQLTQFGIGGDFHWNNVRGRLMTQFGMYAQTTPRNDASPGRGQWDLNTAYRYISEAYGGYHIDKLNGINIDAGIFMSYVGLFSYYQFDNWAYQPSYVSSNTPWFFNGMRIQIFPSDKLKIEPWIVNGWQSYGKFNKAPGLGLQILWRPNSSISVLGNQYWGTDTLGIPGRKRIHTDDSIQVKYLDRPKRGLDKAAFTFTFDAGCEYGNNSGVKCHGGDAATPSQYFLGFMVYNRFWFHKDLFGLTLGGGAITNPGRYLVLIPPINGATAFSGTPYFTANPGDKYRAWDASLTFDYMPTQFSTFRFEYNHRASNVPYFSGPGGITPDGGNTGTPASLVPGFNPDLRKFENRITFAVLVKF
jgi:hypothetical protein